MAREISLSRGMISIVDDQDFGRVSQYKWNAFWNGHKYYAQHTFWNHERRKNVYLHRFILNPPNGIEIDHVDGNGLNCTRANMRECLHAENQKNMPRPRTNSSGYKGVKKHPLCRNWVASITLNGKSQHLGMFPTAIEAAHAYDAAARKQFGEFAKLNFPDET